MPIETFAVDGRVDEEKLHELLQLQSERGALDYKAEAYDLSSLPSKLEFVKDCAGMLSQPDGGYIVLGVDKHGRSVAPPGVPEPHNFDDGGQLRPILVKYFDGDFEVRSQTHVIDGTTIVLIYVGPVGDGLPVVIKMEGQYTEGKKQVVVVRRGQVIIREGTLHRPLIQSDLRRLMHRREEGIRREERARIDGIVEAVRASSVGTQIAHGPLAAITWQLPEDEFSNTILELVRQRDTVALTVAVSGAEADAMNMLRTSDGSIDDFMIVLNRLASILADAVWLGQHELFDQVVNVLYKIYRSRDLDGDPLPGTTFESALVWREIGSRVLAVGGYAVRREAWWAIPPLTLHPVGKTYVYTSWLRHAVTWASRRGLLQHDGQMKPGAGFIMFGRRSADQVKAARRDALWTPAEVTDTVAPRDDVILNSICQFDFLWCLVSVLAQRAHHGTAYYPSFGALYMHRTLPIIERVLRDPVMRAEVIADATDDEVMAAITEIDEAASRESGFDWGMGNDWLPTLVPGPSAST